MTIFVWISNLLNLVELILQQVYQCQVVLILVVILTVVVLTIITGKQLHLTSMRTMINGNYNVLYFRYSIDYA